MHRFDPAKLERLISRDRTEWFPAQPVLDAMCCAPGMTVLDFGAGPGYHSLQIAAGVGPTGAVIATDVEPAMLRRLRQAAAQLSLRNVTTLLIDERGIPLRDRSVDRVLLSLVVHEVGDRARLFAESHRVLSAGGGIAIVEWLPRPTAHGPDVRERLAPPLVAGELRQAGLQPDAETVVGTDCYVLTAWKEPV